MKDINSITLSGRLTRDAEVSQTGAGKTIAKFSIASNRGKKKMNEQWVAQDPNYFNFILFGRLGEVLQQYLIKGAQVVVTGVLQQSRWTDKDGNKKSNIGIIANDVLLVGKKIQGSIQPNNTIQNNQMRNNQEPKIDNVNNAFNTDVEVPFE